MRAASSLFKRKEIVINISLLTRYIVLQYEMNVKQKYEIFLKEMKKLKKEEDTGRLSGHL